MTRNHFLYPWSLSGNRQTVFRFYDDVKAGKMEAILLGTNFRRVADGDWLWFTFTKTDGAIVAVAKAIGEPFQRLGTGSKWEIEVEWIAGLTARLRHKPLSFDVPEQSRQGSPQKVVPKLERHLNRWLSGNYSPQAQAADDSVRLVRRSVLQRQGQQGFRRRLLYAYKEQCAITGCREPETLQAAHIRPVSAKGDNHISNGLLLRADIHNLFDIGLIAIDKNLRIHVASTITGNEYRNLDGKKARVPSSPNGPSRSALAWHHKKFIAANG